MDCYLPFSGDLYNPTKYTKDHRILLFQTAEILALRTGECRSKAEVVKTLASKDPSLDAAPHPMGK